MTSRTWQYVAKVPSIRCCRCGSMLQATDNAEWQPATGAIRHARCDSPSNVRLIKARNHQK